MVWLLENYGAVVVIFALICIVLICNSFGTPPNNKPKGKH